MSSSRERKSLENSPRPSLDNEKNDAFPSEYLEKENNDLQQDANDTPSETVNEDAKPFKGIRLLFIFLGLQISLFLAALDT
jgi:hypothetical protein